MNYPNPKFIFERYFYAYIVFSIISAIILVIVKCQYKIDTLDKFLYVEEGQGFSLEYILYHVILYFLMGFIMGIYVFISTTVKTVLFESAMTYVKTCRYNEFSVYTTAISVVIGISMYIVGAVCNYMVFSQDH